MRFTVPLAVLLVTLFGSADAETLPLRRVRLCCGRGFGVADCGRVFSPLTDASGARDGTLL